MAMEMRLTCNDLSTSVVFCNEGDFSGFLDIAEVDDESGRQLIESFHANGHCWACTETHWLTLEKQA